MLNAARFLSRRPALLGLSVCVALGLASPLAAQDWVPTWPIHIIANQPAGGSTDLMCRLLAQHLSEALGQPVVVENKPGAGGVIGTQLLAQAPADGYTIGTISTSHASNATLVQDLPFDLKDIQPLTLQGRQSDVLVVNPSLAVNSVQELIRLAKANPGTLTFASSGIGVANHIAGEMLKIQAGIDIVHVPYKGGAPALSDVIAGHVPMMFNGLAATLPSVKDVELRALAVTGVQRSPALPDVPTMIEAGLPGFEITEWYGLAVPTGTPPAAIARLYAEIAKVMQRPDVVERLTALGIDIATPPPEQFSEFVRSEIKRYRDVITTAKIEIK